ncbi:MAG: FAD-binding oxidoreductase [Thermoplasmata archaeon]|nr:MAG: FAD-binding oxidoreductase [Thermoplasmata archaeon]
MKDKAEVVIIGGGVNGCGLAYVLAKNGMDDVVVVERNYLGSGATGRCGGGIRQQWSTEENIKLAMESVRVFEKLSDELEYDIEYEQGGYLILAITEDEVEQFRKNVALQNSLGLNSKMLSPDEAKEIVPYLDENEFIAATFCNTDGHANPFRVVEGYARMAKKLGVEIYTHTEVKGFKVDHGRIVDVVTDKGVIRAKYVVNAAGAYSARIAKMAGVELPNKPYRHEILATEPYEHFLDPMVISFHYGIYFSQTKHGEIVGGIGDPEEKPSYNIRSSMRFVTRMARVITKLMPVFKNINIVRQWAGLYDVTPDARPILGPADTVENFLQINGFSGHGFMISPAVTRITADYILYGREDEMLRKLSMSRFKEGIAEREASVVG